MRKKGVLCKFLCTYILKEKKKVKSMIPFKFKKEWVRGKEEYKKITHIQKIGIIRSKHRKPALIKCLRISVYSIHDQFCREDSAKKACIRKKLIKNSRSEIFYWWSFKNVFRSPQEVQWNYVEKYLHIAEKREESFNDEDRTTVGEVLFCASYLCVCPRVRGKKKNK